MEKGSDYKDVVPIGRRCNMDLLSERTIHKTPYMELKEFTVRRENGSIVPYTYPIIKSGVYLVPMYENFDVCLVEQDIFAWGGVRARGCVTGGIERGETEEQTADKELQEEAGLAANRMIPLFEGPCQPSDTMDSLQYAFLAWDLRQVPPNLEETEKTLKTVRMPFYQAIDEIGTIDNRIKEMASQAVLFRAERVMRDHEIRRSIRNPKKY